MEENKPTYEQLANAYSGLVRELEEYKLMYATLKSDKILERLTTMLRIVENKSLYPEKIWKLAVWHTQQIMAKPKA